MDTTRGLLTHIGRYVDLQVSLIATFKEAYPNVSDWEFLLDAPWSGALVVDADTWSFRKHGAGLSFRRTDGLTIDAHCCLSVPEGVDVWRLFKYLETGGADREERVSERSLARELAALEAAGDLVSAGRDGFYRLSTQ